MIKDISFFSNDLKLFGRICLPKGYKTGVIFLHGGGQSNTSRYELLQTEFEKINIASFSFDFQGCGKSEGKFEDGGLMNREVDAKNAVEFFVKESGLDIDQIYIWGSSMGGYIACKLTKQFNFKGIILQSSALYSLKAETVRLNEEFTKLITKDNNWVDSPAFEALKLFKNKKLVIYGDNDFVIPESVKEKYKSLIGKNDKYVIIENGSHALLNPQNDLEKQALQEVANEGIDFIT